MACTNQKSPPDHIEAFFTPDAVARLAGAYYDSERGEVVSEDDDQLDAIEACEEDILLDLMEMPTDKATVDSPAPALTSPDNPQRPAPPKMAVRNLLGGSDSVTTFHTKATSKAPSKKTKAASTSATSDSQSVTNDSVFTADDCLEFQSLKSSQEKSQNDILAICNELSTLTGLLSTFQHPQVRQPGESAPGADSPSAAVGEGLQ